MVFGRKATDEQKTSAEEQETESKKEIRREVRLRRQFDLSPQGRARHAFETGDELFQFSMGVMSQTAIIVIMVGSTTTQETTEPSAVLNAVSREGWRLLDASFVFVEQGQQGRDKFLASGQNVAIKGETMGYYVFCRDASLRRLTEIGPVIG